MNIIIKTIGNKKFPLVDVAAECTVTALRQRINDELDLGGEVKKLIFKGKTLKDGQTLATAGVNADDQIVCLVKKQRGSKKSPQKAPAATAPPAEAAVAAPAGPTSYQIQMADIQRLMQMGFPQHMVIISLKAAYGNPSVAAQYLIAGGIPADRAEALQKEHQALAAQQGVSAPSSVVPQPAQQAPPARGPQGMDARFEAMLANKDSMAGILSNPQVQQQCIQMLAVENPELLNRFLQDPDKVGETEEFMKAMFHILSKSFSTGPSAARPQRRTITLTEEDRAALAQLQETKHLSRQQAAQIYVQNGKSLERSIAFCDRMMEQARAMNPDAAATDRAENAAQPKQPAPTERRPLGQRSAAQAGSAPAPATAKENDASAAHPGADATVLSISPDMLLEDDEE